MALTPGLSMAAFNTCVTSNLTGVKFSKSHNLHFSANSKLTLCKMKMRTRVNVCAASRDALPRKQSSIKEFMEEIKSLGRIRIVVKTGVAVLGAVTRMDNLSYHSLEGKAEFANVIDKGENMDFHILMDEVKGAQLVQGRAKKRDFYTISFTDEKGTAVVTFLLMWNPDADGKYDHDQIKAFRKLQDKYGSGVTFV